MSSKILTNIVTLFTMFAWNYYFLNSGLFLDEYICFNVTTNLQSLLHLYILISGFAKHKIKFPCGNSLFQDKTLTHYHNCNMSTWYQYEKSISSWIHFISNKRIQAPGHHPFLLLNHPPTFEASNHQTKNNFLQKFHTVGFPPIGNSS